MGQSCTKVPRVGRDVIKRRAPETMTLASVSRASSHQQASSGQPTAHLCSHNVCSMLRRKDWDAAKTMIRTGEGLDITLTKFLERALYEGCPGELVEMILTKGANPLDSSRCLSDAVLGKVDYKVVKLLLDMGCSPNQASEQDKLKRTPMHFACQTHTSLEIMDLLLEYGGHLNDPPAGERLWTPLHYLACANHDPAMLDKLVLKGAEINARALDGTTPLAIAAFKRAPASFFRAMLGVGADPTVATRFDRIPLHYLRTSDEKAVLATDDIRLTLLDPQIHLKQLQALASGLHERLGKLSPVNRLSPELLVMIGRFVLKAMVPPCDDDDGEEDYFNDIN